MMQRARHLSLDFAASPQQQEEENWSQLLSTSIAALATDERDEPRLQDAAAAVVAHEDELFAQHQQDVMDAAVAVAASPRARASPIAIDTFAAASRGPSTAPPPSAVLGSPPPAGDEFLLLGLGKPRSDSISEALTSSTESSPSGAAWRPLGRRLTAQQSANGGSASTQLEHHLFEAPAAFGGPLDGPTLAHTSSFRDLVTLSSSGSSLYESSSSDDEQQDATAAAATTGLAGGGGARNGGMAERAENTTRAFRMMMRKGSAPALTMRPSLLDADAPPFGEAASLSLLAPLPAHPRSLSIDNTFASAHHVKSPVLGNRKDSQTWQLQDEELLKTSPRFGPLGSGDMSMFGSAGLLIDELSNQVEEELPRSRFTKDARASSVDFTYISSTRPSDVNPPLPPAPEPLQRLRAKSFSYSSGYGASAGYANAPGYSNTSGGGGGGKQYQPHHQPTLHDYHGNMRSYQHHQHQHHHHRPVGSPPPVSSPPPSGGIRPPRVNIPSDSPMHQYHQYGPPQYRRYSSDTFAMPPYPDMYSPAEQENQARHSNSSRGMRSFSMETSTFASSRPFRSQSMEGAQLFAAVGAPEYPTMTRTNSAGMGYDWPRGPMDLGGPAPPLPPDSRGGGGNNSTGHHHHHHHYPSPPPEAYYEVEFKRGRQEIFAGNASYNAGDFVKVEADRGEDIGRIVQRATELSKLQGSSGASNDPTSPRDESLGRAPKRHDAPVKKIIAVANQREREMLNEQRKEEHEVFEVCKSKVRQRLLPMNVIDAEYQFDRHKLTFFFEADRRIDFRELVRDLFAIYKTRIWLQQVVPSGGKKVMVDYDA
ncbi:hypothetical protein PybrP1_005881 [[Pythium] brassicae (nom. inval.)]|nr:hypothetical protein PybrP1_005881 [[Pythium] brassicae (nom. inval.)]